jgi:hypothetical protein
MEPYVRRLFVEAAGTALRAREKKIATALNAHFKEDNEGVIYLKSKHISEKLNDVLTPEQIGQGMKELQSNSHKYDVKVSKRAYNSATVWQVET